MTARDDVRVIVADDEPLARRFLAERLAATDGIDVVASCANGRETVSAVREHRPDLLFLDIQMPELDGFGVLDELPPDQRPVVIFVTAFDEYAVRAFEVEALDYVLKPFDDDRLKAAVARAETRLCHGGRDSPQQQVERALAARRTRTAPRRLAVHEGDRIRFVNVWDIDWLEAHGKRALVHVGDDAHLSKQSIGALQEWLDKDQFLRISRSAIVNLDRVSEIQRWFQGQFLVVLRSGARLATTRTYRHNLDILIKLEGEGR